MWQSRRANNRQLVFSGSHSAAQAKKGISHVRFFGESSPALDLQRCQNDIHKVKNSFFFVLVAAAKRALLPQPLSYSKLSRWWRNMCALICEHENAVAFRVHRSRNLWWYEFTTGQLLFAFLFSCCLPCGSECFRNAHTKKSILKRFHSLPTSHAIYIKEGLWLELNDVFYEKIEWKSWKTFSRKMQIANLD